MCGIVGYIGNREAFPILIKGLKRLEYRGYDSAGVALIGDDLNIFKKAGKVVDLEGIVDYKKISATIGIGHTRWATHGEPNDRNAHPHLSNNGKLAIIHNGIIENYASIKEELTKRGYIFHSDTDTEVLVNLIEEVMKKENTSLDHAVRIALNEVVGAYAIVVLNVDNPDQLIAARKGSPLVIGIGTDEFYIASDASPIIEYTKNVVYLDDQEYAVINRDGQYSVRTLGNIEKSHEIQKLEFYWLGMA
jgi:glucosamine--fructose-6-phosphate aminotransferase (isomerizing)